jgi:hypothetical protein
MPRIAMFRRRSPTSLKIDKGELTKVAIGIAEPMRVCDMKMFHLIDKGAWRIYNVIQRCLMQASRLY